jgi:DNA-binding HxlR family transcriptional regulator
LLLSFTLALVATIALADRRALCVGTQETTHEMESRWDMATYSLRRSFSCPVELALEILGGKWKTVILAHLKERSLRYAELRALIPALTDKVLTERLRDLEALDLVVRHKHGGRGAPSRYELTRRGRTLGPVLQGLYDWGEHIADEVGATIEGGVRQSVVSA